MRYPCSPSAKTWPPSTVRFSKVAHSAGCVRNTATPLLSGDSLAVDKAGPHLEVVHGLGH
jgi:hypothetical protein